MTADHVHRLTAPALDRAVPQHEIVDSGELDGVVVSLRADVGDVDLFQNDMVGRGLENARVVDVDAVVGLLADGDVPQREVTATGEVQAFRPALEKRRTLRVGLLDDDRCVGRAVNALDPHARPVASGGDHDVIAGPGGRQHGPQGRVIPHQDGPLGRGGKARPQQ